MTPRIVPSESQPTIEGPCMVDSDGVKRVKCIYEVVGVVLAGAFDAEVVDHQCEDDGERVVVP